MTSQAEPVKCKRCGRQLRSARSIAAGYGRSCKARVFAALDAAAPQLAEYTDEQLSKAADALLDDAVVPASPAGRALYLVASSDGSDRYHTTSNSCTCSAAQYGRRCYHRAAVILAHAIAAA